MVLRITYEIHRGNFTGSSKVWNASIRVGNLGYNFSAIVHRHEERFVEHAVRVLLDRDASSSSHRFCCDSCEAIHVKSNLSLPKVLCLINNKAATREFKKLIVRVPI